MNEDLARIDAEAWTKLADATRPGAAQSLRFVTLGTLNDGAPSLRLLVLRQVWPTKRILELHTDMRSRKWTELTAANAVCVLGYDDEARVQLKLEGSACLFAPGTDENEAAWATLSAWTQNTYAGGPPGDPLESEGLPLPKDAQPDTLSGRPHFGVIQITIRALDWVMLARGNNRRAVFDYAEDGSTLSGAWVTP